MATACIAQVTFGFEPKEKPIVAAFDMPHVSSVGGACSVGKVVDPLTGHPPVVYL